MRRYKTELPRIARKVPPSLMKALRECRQAVSPWPLFMHGGAGVGKTRAALLFLDWTWNPIYWELEPLCADLIDAMNGTEKTGLAHGYRVSKDELWGRWSKADVGVLDEIGTRMKVSDHRYDTLKTALDKREDKPTIYISNCGPGAIEKLYDARIASRLCAGTIVEVVGDDMRLKQ